MLNFYDKIVFFFDKGCFFFDIDNTFCFYFRIKTTIINNLIKLKSSVFVVLNKFFFLY